MNQLPQQSRTPHLKNRADGLLVGKHEMGKTKVRLLSTDLKKPQS